MIAEHQFVACNYSLSHHIVSPSPVDQSLFIIPLETCHLCALPLPSTPYYSKLAVCGSALNLKYRADLIPFHEIGENDQRCRSNYESHKHGRNDDRLPKRIPSCLFLLFERQIWPRSEVGGCLQSLCLLKRRAKLNKQADTSEDVLYFTFSVTNCTTKGTLRCGLKDLGAKHAHN